MGSGLLVGGLMMGILHRAVENAVVTAFTRTESWLGKIAVLVVAFAVVAFVKWLIEGGREPDQGRWDEPDEDEDADQDERRNDNGKSEAECRKAIANGGSANAGPRTD